MPALVFPPGVPVFVITDYIGELASEVKSGETTRVESFDDLGRSFLTFATLVAWSFGIVVESEPDSFPGARDGVYGEIVADADYGHDIRYPRLDEGKSVDGRFGYDNKWIIGAQSGDIETAMWYAG